MRVRLSIQRDRCQSLQLGKHAECPLRQNNDDDGGGDGDDGMMGITSRVTTSCRALDKELLHALSHFFLQNPPILELWTLRPRGVRAAPASGAPAGTEEQEADGQRGHPWQRREPAWRPRRGWGKLVECFRSHRTAYFCLVCWRSIGDCIGGNGSEALWPKRSTSSGRL